MEGRRRAEEVREEAREGRGREREVGSRNGPFIRIQLTPLDNVQEL